MLGVMGLPITETLAEYAGVPAVDASMLSQSQKARTCFLFQSNPRTVPER